MDKQEKILPDSYPLYGRDHPPLFELFRSSEKATQTYILREFSHKTELIEAILNADYAIGSYYMGITLSPNVASRHPRTDIIFSAYHKNLFALYAGFELTSRGLYGPARSILRHTFESLIIAKFCSLASNSEVYTKWQQGETIYFTNSVLKKIKKPSPAVFQEYWKTMSEFVHATVYAQQISFAGENLCENIQFNLDLILALAECHYHILISYLVTPSVRYYSDYGANHLGQDEKAGLSRQKQAIRALFSDAKKRTIPSLRKLVNQWC